jgi:hypothetical protein
MGKGGCGGRKIDLTINEIASWEVVDEITRWKKSVMKI